MGVARLDALLSIGVGYVEALLTNSSYVKSQLHQIILIFDFTILNFNLFFNYRLLLLLF